MICTHELWTAKKIPLSNGRPALREFCVSCGMSNGGSNLGIALPTIADKDLPILSYKYPKKTLGEIMEIDKAYILWLIVESKASDRIKKSAARLYYGQGYVPPNDGEIYSHLKKYDPRMGGEFLRIIKQNESER